MRRRAAARRQCEAARLNPTRNTHPVGFSIAETRDQSAHARAIASDASSSASRRSPTRIVNAPTSSAPTASRNAPASLSNRAAVRAAPSAPLNDPGRVERPTGRRGTGDISMFNVRAGTRVDTHSLTRHVTLSGLDTVCRCST
jgi:hypothetical protein